MIKFKDIEIGQVFIQNENGVESLYQKTSEFTIDCSNGVSLPANAITVNKSFFSYNNNVHNVRFYNDDDLLLTVESEDVLYGETVEFLQKQRKWCPINKD